MGDATATAFEYLPLASISESPTNPRKSFDKEDLAELTDDVARRGVLQPVLVRKSKAMSGAGYELVFGHRRFRAAKGAGLQTVPAMVRELGDAEVLELQLIENVKRSDLHPLEAADGYRQLHEVHGLPIEQVAKRVGKSVGTIYQALSVARLGARARKAWLADEMSAGVARLLARIPAGPQQDLAFEGLEESYRGEALQNAFEAGRVLDRFVRDLSRTPFEREVAYGALPTCLSCEKRSGAQPQLFSDVKQKDMCLDVGCWAAKQKAWWDDQLKWAAMGKGPRCLTAAETKEAVDDFGAVRYGGEWVKADDTHPTDAKRRTWKALLGKEAKKHIAIALTEKGEVLRLVEKKAVSGVLKKVGLLDAGAVRSDGTRVSKAQVEKAKKERAEEKVRKKVQALVIALAAAAAEKRKPSEQSVLELLARLAAVSAPWSVRSRRQAPSTPVEWETTTESMTPGQRLGLVLEVLLEDACLQDNSGDYPPALKWAAEELDVDMGDVEEQVRDGAGGGDDE